MENFVCAECRAKKDLLDEVDDLVVRMAMAKALHILLSAYDQALTLLENAVLASPLETEVES